MYANYQMLLGGRSDGDTRLGETCLRVPAKRVIPVILKIIEVFKENKKETDTLKTWIHRVVNNSDDSKIQSIKDIQKLLEPVIIPPTKDDDPDFYLDYGSDSSYHTKTGRGECAA
jgi:sulfite reductase (ferredoxin)